MNIVGKSSPVAAPDGSLYCFVYHHVQLIPSGFLVSYFNSLYVVMLDVGMNCVEMLKKTIKEINWLVEGQRFKKITKQMKTCEGTESRSACDCSVLLMTGIELNKNIKWQITKSTHIQATIYFIMKSVVLCNAEDNSNFQKPSVSVEAPHYVLHLSWRLQPLPSTLPQKTMQTTTMFPSRRKWKRPTTLNLEVFNVTVPNHFIYMDMQVESNFVPGHQFW